MASTQENVWEKCVFFNHTPLLGYRLSIISIRYLTIPLDLIDSKNVDIDLSTINDIPMTGYCTMLFNLGYFRGNEYEWV